MGELSDMPLAKAGEREGEVFAVTKISAAFYVKDLREKRGENLLYLCLIKSHIEASGRLIPRMTHSVQPYRQG